ncbi:MAG TPA: phosphoglucosamine mutase [Alphaproteobacteria bacterium]|nr:phosphoglucosamine mutase [Alphaproteobacteria bacterium]
MARKYFGTDGIRGTANKFPMTADIALRVGMAAGQLFTQGDHRHKVIIGKDTRLSGYMVEPALTAGFTSVGMDVVLLGPVPTPAVAMLTRSMRADIGVMISASHNPFGDNGIKLFGPDGYKLSDENEIEIERRMENGIFDHLVAPDMLGRAKRLEDAGARYIEFVKSTVPRGLRLDGLRVVIDCANGAAYRVAPTVLWELGADVIAIGVEPNGFNINQDCGSTHLQKLSDKVCEVRADIGIALDGDADRVLICDEQGKEVDGDQIMALISAHWQQSGRLTRNGVVGTVMANLGLERYLKGLGIELLRTQVGDRYVVEKMRQGGYNLGGEQSGHIVMNDYTTTGDGLISALQILWILRNINKPVSEALDVFERAPQILHNVRYKNGEPLNRDSVKAAITDGEAQLGEKGRLVIRKSGTEPVVRVMAEGEDEPLVRAVVSQIVTALEAEV